MESPCWTDDVPDAKEASAPRGHPAEFRRKVLDLVDSGRAIREIAHGLGISEQTIYVRRRQHLVDTGQLPGPTSQDRAELVVARRRIAELEAEPAAHRQRRHSAPGMLTPVEFELRSIPAIAQNPATRLHASRAHQTFRVGLGELTLAGSLPGPEVSNARTQPRPMLTVR
ncbi:transposase [Streptomyces sp. NPDC057238]|uniref:transposase n=1 Tax=unclassified Streptomyces TaxID=2593676 RepID=UPI0036332141